MRDGIGHRGKGIVVTLGVTAPLGNGNPCSSIVGGGQHNEAVIVKACACLGSIGGVIFCQHIVERQLGILGEIEFGSDQPVFARSAIKVDLHVRRFVESGGRAGPATGGASQSGTIGRINIDSAVAVPAGGELVHIGDVIEVHAPRQGHGGATGGEARCAGGSGVTPTDAADINGVVGAGRQATEGICGGTRDSGAVGVGAVAPAHDITVGRAGIGPGEGGAIGRNVRGHQSGRTATTAHGVDHQAVDIAGDGSGAGAGLHDGDAVAAAGIATQLHLELIPANLGRREGGQTGKGGSVGNAVADTDSNLHLVHIGSASTVFIEEAHLQSVHV